MKKIVFTNMTVEFLVPDSVKVDENTGLSGYVAVHPSEKKVEVKKDEPVERRKSNITRFEGGANVSLSFNTDNHSAKGYITLRANEDWKAMRQALVDQVLSAFDKLIETAK